MKNRPEDEIKKNVIKKQKRKFKENCESTDSEQFMGVRTLFEEHPLPFPFLYAFFGLTSPFRANQRIFEWPLLEIPDCISQIFMILKNLTNFVPVDRSTHLDICSTTLQSYAGKHAPRTARLLNLMC